jgi:hypothetical protein
MVSRVALTGVATGDEGELALEGGGAWKAVGGARHYRHLHRYYRYPLE